MDRFAFQRECCSKVTGKILNAGCHIDPAQLKINFPNQVTNLDILDYEIITFRETGEIKPLPVDLLCDITKFPWPFNENEFDLVVLGDILEDLPDNNCQLSILTEARRIANYLCITTPQDTPQRDSHHLTTITEIRLKEWLQKTKWNILDFRVIDYGFVPEGYLVFATKEGVQ